MNNHLNKDGSNKFGIKVQKFWLRMIVIYDKKQPGYNE